MISAGRFLRAGFGKNAGTAPRRGRVSAPADAGILRN